jgi:hypothetical protein
MPEIDIIESFLGRNTENVETSILPGHASVAVDVDFRSTRGCLQGAKAHSSLYAIGQIYGLKSWTSYLVASLSSSLYSNGIIVAGDGATWGGTFNSTEFQGKLLLVNGTSIKKFDGTNLYNVGITAPVVGSFAAAGNGSGSFNVLNWSYVVTFYNGDGYESNATTAVVASSQGAGKLNVSLTGIPTGATADNVTGRRIYRSIDGGSSYFLLTIITNNSATTYSDTTIDASLGVTSPPTNHDKPTQSCTLVERASNRWFLSGSSSYPRRVFFSLPSPYGEAWPLEYYEDFPGTVKGLCALGDNLIVLTSDGPYIFMGIADINSLYVKELPNRIPSKSARANTQFDNKVYWRGPSGVFSTNGISVVEDSDLVKGMFANASDASSIEADSNGTIHIVLSNFYSSTSVGKIVRIVDGDTGGGTYLFSAEVGKIVRMTGADTYTFKDESGNASEYGMPLYIGALSGDIGTVIQRDLRDDNILWSMSSQNVTLFANDNLNRVLYAGNRTGVVTCFTGTRMAWTWKSVKNLLKAPNKRKRLIQVSLRVNGSLTVNLYGDDVLLHTEALTETALSTVKVKVPRDSWFYEFQIEFIGSSTGIVNPPVTIFYELEKLI